MPKKFEIPIGEAERLLTMKQVCAITSWSRTSVNRLVEKGAFPTPIKLGAQRIAFKEGEVRDYVASRNRRNDGFGDRVNVPQVA